MRKVKTRRRRGLLVILLVAAVFAFLIYDGNTRLVVDEYRLEYANLPAAFDGYRIVQLSDIHCARFGNENAGLLAAVVKARPNIIAITGDLISYTDGPDDIRDVVLPLVRALTEIAPVYYVTGNHEWDNDHVHTLLRLLEQNGVTVLGNAYARLSLGEDVIILAGLHDPNGPKDMKTPETLLGEIRGRFGDPFVVLLGHRNNRLKQYAALEVDLVLCGHAHGGLIRLPFLGGLIGTSRDLFPEYAGGVYSAGGTRMLVSRGIGNGTGIFRFLNNPQVVVAVLRTDGDAVAVPSRR